VPQLTHLLIDHIGSIRYFGHSWDNYGTYVGQLKANYYDLSLPIMGTELLRRGTS
jgi:hypothetical protein